MKAAERAVVVKVLAKALRKARDEYGHTVATLKSELLSRLSAVESLFDDISGQLGGKATKDDIEALTNLIAEIPEGRKGKDGLDGKDGQSVYVEDVLPHLQEQLKAAIEALPAPKDGKDGADGESVTVDDVRPLLETEVARWALDFERRAQGILSGAIERIPTPKDGVNGKDADPDDVAKRIIDKLNLSGTVKEDVRKLCAELVSSAMAKIEIPEPEKPSDEQVEKAVCDYLKSHPIPTPKDGKSVTADDVLPVLRKELKAAIKAIPEPKDGRDGIDGKDATDDQVRAAVVTYLESHPIQAGKDGLSVTVDDVMPALRAELQSAIDAIPVPKDGKDGISVTVDEVIPYIKAAIDEFPRPKDGVDGKDGKSVTVDDLLPVLDSTFWKWALDWEKRSQEMLQRCVDRIPIPKDGKNGRDGIDFNNLQFLLGEDGRTVTLALDNGDTRVERSLLFPVPQYREVWKKDTEYAPGDWVTWDGSIWACLKSTKQKPGQYNRDWRLAIKRGRNAPTPPKVE